MSINFRSLRADEIECRIAQVSKQGKGLSLLLYKNARCDMNILDETVGTQNWQREHYECKGNLFCRIGIREPGTDDWVWKADCGTESNTEAQKGEASDSFKRAGFNWGIGRELYTAPFIWIGANACNLKANEKGTYKCNDKFSVSHIVIKDKKIVELVIVNETTHKEVFAFGTGKQSYQQPNPQNTPSQDTQIEYVLESDVKKLVKLLKTKNITQKSVCEDLGIKSLRQLTMEQYSELCDELTE